MKKSVIMSVLGTVMAMSLAFAGTALAEEVT